MKEKADLLQNIRVLITRPVHQAAALCQLIERHGGQAILLPTITIEFLDTRLKELSLQNIAIFISPNAVQAAHSLMQKQEVVWPKNLVIAAVGASTAQALDELGLTVTLVPEQFNSE